MRLLKWRFVGCLVLMIAGMVCAVLASPSSASRQLASQAAPTKALLTLLQEAKTYQADFQQTTVNAKGESVGQVSQGVMRFKRPGRMRWETIKPNQQLLVSDGKLLWVYDKDLEQATRRPAVVEGQWDPVSLLTGSQTDMDKVFDVTLARQDEKNRLTFTLKPKKSKEESQQPMWMQIQMIFVKNQLTGLVMSNSFGQITHFRFTNIKLNQAMSDTLFEFKPPKGVDVLTQ